MKTIMFINILKVGIRKVIYFTFLVTLIHFVTACEDFVHVPPPETQIVDKTVFENDATATAVILNIYGRMNLVSSFAAGHTESITYLQGLYADELELFSTNPEQQGFYENNLFPLSSKVASIWGDCYELIYISNSILEGLSKSSSITPSVKDQLSGEAKFIRAFCHFYLVNLFGNIPYISTTDYKINAQVSRIEASEVYKFIIDDLISAEGLLSSQYISQGRVRPNKWAAKALLSRAYLYMGDWIKAESESSSVIAATDLYNLSSLDEVFLKDNSEAIWQLHPSTGSNNGYEGEVYILLGTPTRVTMSEDLIDAFEYGDNRRKQWVDSSIVSSEVYYYPHKYKMLPADAETEYSMVLRLAEQYLIRAEARANQGKLADAITDLDIIRQRAGLLLIANSNPSIDQADLLLAIQNERRIELFTEWGHRWFDLKRTNRADQVLPQTKQGWDSNDILLPIPEAEILKNQNLKPQNEGY